jgi:hypothetical protein
MGRVLQNVDVLNVRLPANLSAAVEDAARREVMTVSEYVRAVLYKNVQPQMTRATGKSKKVARKLMSFTEHGRWYADQKERRNARLLRKVEDEQRKALMRGLRPCER